jgi:hypothetical protein
MARRREQEPDTNVLEAAAVNIGHALGTIARRVDAWKKDRADITADINQVITRAQEMLDDIGRTPTPDAIGSLGEIAHVAPPEPKPRQPRRSDKRAAASARPRGAARASSPGRKPRRQTG